MDLVFGLVALFFLSFLLFKFLNFYFYLFYFILLFYLFISFFLPFLLSRVADRVLVLRPGVRPVPLRWESQVQDIGPPETSQLHIISNGKGSPRDLCLNAEIQQVTLLDTLWQTTSKTGTQPHPLADRLPKIIIRSQTPQNTPLDAILPTRKTRYSLIHQNTGTSPHHQEAYTTHWTNLSHWGETPKTTGTTNLQPA